MSMMLFTDANVAFLKRGIREQFPQIKSGHLSEAIAFSAGFRTHAALIAAMKAQSNGRDFLVGMNAGQLALRLRELEYPIASIGDLETFTHAEDLPNRMYVVTKRAEHYLRDRWFYECRDRNIPFLYIERKTKYVRLHWDCISLDPANEAHVTGDAGTALGRLMFSNFQRIARQRPGKAFYEGSSFVGSVKDLEPKVAHEMAETFFAMLYLPLYSQVKVA